MIIILHGENASKSREIITQVKQKLDLKVSDENLTANKKEFKLADISENELLEEITSFGLFSDPPFIILDITNMGRTKVDSYVEVLQKAPKEVTIVIYSIKNLTKSNAFIKNAEKLSAKIVENSVEPKANVFKFVDYVMNKKKKQAIKELSTLISDGEDYFYIFSMILYGLRNIAYAVFDSNELSKVSPYAKTKAMNQAKTFGEREFKNLYSEIYQIDKMIKTGKIQAEIGVMLAINKIAKN